MTLVLYWVSFALAMAGTVLAIYGFVARRMAPLVIGLVLLAAGFALFGVWSILTISGFLGSVLLFTAALIVMMLLKPNSSSAQPHDARRPSHDPVS
jgi:hypothetical protein